jgi:hypothetical protein
MYLTWVELKELLYYNRTSRPRSQFSTSSTTGFSKAGSGTDLYTQ